METAPNASIDRMAAKTGETMKIVLTFDNDEVEQFIRDRVQSLIPLTDKDVDISPGRYSSYDLGCTVTITDKESDNGTNG